VDEIFITYVDRRVEFYYMRVLKKFFRYLKYILRHKYFVGRECFKRYLFWQGITHDLSKLSLQEFIPYMNSFSDERVLELRKKENKTDTEKFLLYQVKQAFNKAWLHHQKVNPHHWQYWIIIEGKDRMTVLDMPECYLEEMLCDWIGAGMAITGKREVWEWYDKNKDSMILSDYSRSWIENQRAIEKLKERKEC